MKLKIFITYHNKLFFENYQYDKYFSEDYYTFLKISNIENKYKYLPNMLDVSEFTNYYDIGNGYGEYQALINLFKNKKYYKGFDQIGISQYDKYHQTTGTNQNNITEQILVNLGINNHVSLETHDFTHDYHEKIMMDETRPTELQGDGINVYDIILKEYNEFHNTNYTLNDLHGKPINLCSCFVLPVPVFEKIMLFISEVIESKRLDKYSATPFIQAGLLERYLGVALMLEPNLIFKDINIFHLNQK